MRNLLLILFLGICTFSIKAQNINTTTYYLIRHAEKVRTDASDRNPHLNESGIDRAIFWSTVFKDIAFDMVYTTNYNRTIQTALPTAKSKNLELNFYDPKDMYNNPFIDETKGKNVLIVGHSNTTPQFVNKILKEEKYGDIEDNNNSNLYIVTLLNESISTVLLKIPLN